MSSDYYGNIAGELADEGIGTEYIECDGCTCCTWAGCHGGPDSECPYSEETLSFLCPCTGE